MTIDVRIIYTLSPAWNTSEWLQGSMDYSNAVGLTKKILTGSIKDSLWKKISNDLSFTILNGVHQIRTDSIPVKGSLFGKLHLTLNDDKLTASFDFLESRKTWYASKIYDNPSKLLQDLYHEIQDDLSNPIVQGNVTQALSNILTEFWKQRNVSPLEELISDFSRKLALILEPYYAQARSLSVHFTDEELVDYGAPYVLKNSQPLHWECIRIAHYLYQTFCIVDKQPYIPWTEELPSLPEHLDMSFLKTRVLSLPKDMSFNNKDKPVNLVDAPVTFKKIQEYGSAHKSPFINEDVLRLVWNVLALIEYGNRLGKVDNLIFSRQKTLEIIKDKKTREAVLQKIPSRFLGHNTYLDEAMQFWEHGGFLQLSSGSNRVSHDASMLLTEYFTAEAATHMGYSSDSVEVYSLESALDVWKKVENTEVGKKFEPYFMRLSKWSTSRFFVTAQKRDVLEELYCKFPNISEVTSFVAKQLSLCHLQDRPHFKLPSILLLGNPGLGKTRYLNALTTALKVPMHEVSMSSLSASFVLSGSDFTWGGGRPGKIAEIFLSDLCVNPIFVLDEIDKAGGDDRYDPLGPLYQLLEKHTAKRFFDEALQISFDTSHFSWCATANREFRIPEPIMNRFKIFNIPDLSNEDIPIVAQSIYDDIRQENAWGAHFSEDLETDIFPLLYGKNARDIYFMLFDAFGTAAEDDSAEKPLVLKVSHFAKAPPKRNIGFLS